MIIFVIGIEFKVKSNVRKIRLLPIVTSMDLIAKAQFCQLSSTMVFMVVKIVL